MLVKVEWTTQQRDFTDIDPIETEMVRRISKETYSSAYFGRIKIHQVVLGFFKVDQKNLGVLQFSLPERAFDQTSHTHQLQLTETAVLNKTTVNETRFQFIRNRNEQTAVNTGVATNVHEAFFAGGATVGDSFNESTRWEVTNSTTWAHGLHSVTP